MDAADDVYVADLANNRIQKFSSAGAFITKWGSLGAGDGAFSFPGGVAADTSGRILVTDTTNYRVQKFQETATLPAARAAALLVTALLLAVGAGFAVRRSRKPMAS